MPGPIPAGLLLKALDKLKGGGKYMWDVMWGNKIPKWALPVFGATAAAPVIAHELDPKARMMVNTPEKNAELRKRAKAAVQTSFDDKAAQLERLDSLKQHLTKAKRRPVKKEKGTPSMKFRYADKAPR